MMWALLLAVLLAQDDWIAKLGSDDVDVRAEAKRKLVEGGEKGLPALRKALQGAKDADLKARLLEIMARVGRAQAPAGVKIEIVLPKDPPTLERVWSEDFKVAIRVTNGNDFEVVVWSSFVLEVFDAAGKESPHATYIGAGIRPSGCFLKEGKWITLEPGKSADASSSLKNWTLDFRVVQLGWNLPRAGAYTLACTTSYSRQEFVGRCKGCKERHDDPESPWNRALDLKRTAKAALVVKE